MIDPARHERRLDFRRRLEHVGGDQPDSRSDDRAQLRLALLGGQRQPGYDPNLNICPTQPQTTAPVLHLQPQRVGRRRRRLPDGQLFGCRHHLLPGHEQLSFELQQRPVLLGLLASLRLGHVPGWRRQPEPGQHHRPSRRARRDLSTSTSGRTATSTTSTSTAARSSASSVRTQCGRRGDHPSLRPGAADRQTSTARGLSRRRPETRSPSPGI